MNGWPSTEFKLMRKYLLASIATVEMRHRHCGLWRKNDIVHNVDMK